MHRRILPLSLLLLAACTSSPERSDTAAQERRAAEAAARFHAKREAEKPAPESEWEILLLERSGRDDRGVIHETTTETLRIPRQP